MAKHRGHYKFWKSTGKGSFVRSFELFEEYRIGNCFIEFIEAKSCMNGDEKNKLEGKYIRELEFVNKNMTGRTDKEFREDNKEKLEDKPTKYYEDNKEAIIERVKEYSEENKELITERHKIYRIKNAAKIKEQKIRKKM
jgi:adenylate kinase family enzyme